MIKSTDLNNLPVYGARGDRSQLHLVLPHQVLETLLDTRRHPSLPPLPPPRPGVFLLPVEEVAGGDAVASLNDAVAHVAPLPGLLHQVREGVGDDLPPQVSRPLLQGDQDLVPPGVHLPGDDGGQGGRGGGEGQAVL